MNVVKRCLAVPLATAVLLGAIEAVGARRRLEQA